MLTTWLILLSLLSSFINTKHHLRTLSKTITLPVVFEENEDYYVIALGIGNPRTYFPVQIDTSTTTTWVPSTNCNNCHSLSLYNSSISNTSTVKNQFFILSDEDGDIEGVLTFDEIEVHSFILSNFGFLQASRLLGNFTDHEDGKLGLGYHHELGHEMNFIEMLKKKDIISERIFSIKEVNFTHGELLIGAAPVAKYPYCELISTEDLDDEYKEGWVCRMHHIAFFKTSAGFEGNATTALFKQAIEVNSMVSFDSAASYITAPLTFLPIFEREIFENYQSKCYKAQEGNSTVFRCEAGPGHTAFGEGVELHFFFEGFSYLIPLKELFEDVDNKTFEFFIRFRHENDPIWNLGHPFMRKFQIIFNAEENHVGLIGLSNDFVKEWTEWKDTSKTGFTFSWQLGIIIIGSLFLVLLIAFLIYWFTREKKETLIKTEQKEQKEAVNDQFNTASDRNFK